jgi:integrase
VLTVEQARAFIPAIAGHPYEALFALAMTTGMRPSEYLALAWVDIDFVQGAVRVSRTLEWRRGGWQFADTKRARSRRAIKLQSWVIDLLEQRRQRTAPQTSAGPAQDLVFLAKRGGPIRESRFVWRYFKPLLRSAGLPNIRLYDLRHTAATLSLAAGVSPKVVSEQLGHASVAFTLDVYSHVLPHMQEAAAAKVEALLRGPE